MKQRIRKWASLGTGVASFGYLIFVLNPIQMLSVATLPFSRRTFRSINRWCARSIWGLWVVQAEVQNAMDIRFCGDLPRPRENAMVVPNHQSMADVMVMLCLAWRCGHLGDLKFFVKNAVKYFPGFGWGMLFLDCIFVKRNWADDEAEIHRLFDKFKREDIPLFLVSFLEGTRRTPAKWQQARSFAEERGLHVPEHTLVPRAKGFTATILGLREHLDAVYDVTVGYHEDPAPTLVSCFANEVPRVDVHVRRFPIDSLPTGDEELASWARERFREKDELLAHFREHGSFPGQPFPSRVRARDWFLGDRHRASQLEA